MDFICSMIPMNVRKRVYFSAFVWGCVEGKEGKSHFEIGIQTLTTKTIHLAKRNKKEKAMNGEKLDK